MPSAAAPQSTISSWRTVGVRTRRFEATVPGVTATGPAVSAALNQAANQVAGEVADWIG